MSKNNFRVPAVEQAAFRVIQEPVRLDKIYERMFKTPQPKLRGERKQKDIQKFEALIERSEIIRLKYLLEIIWIGAELQRIITQIDKEGVLDLKRIRAVILPFDHPSIRDLAEIKAGKLSDDQKIAWVVCLEDTLDFIRAHVQSFIATYQMRVIADFTPR